MSNEKHYDSLSFDGKGINGRDEYRTRIATFESDSGAEEFGLVFAAAPEMYDVIPRLIKAAGQLMAEATGGAPVQDWGLVNSALVDANKAVAKAKGKRKRPGPSYRKELRE